MKHLVNLPVKPSGPENIVTCACDRPLLSCFPCRALRWVRHLLTVLRVRLNRTRLAGWLECVAGNHDPVLVIPAPGESWRHECRRCPLSFPDDRVLRLPRWAR